MSGAKIGQIGRYKIVGELGRGGFGCVYRGFDASVGRQVAIKVLTERGKEILARFRNEAKVAGNLRHENIVTVYEYGEYQGQPFLAMEYLEGEDLQHILSSGKQLSLLEKCDVMSQVAEGLHCAHSNGVVHRDVKPANIMVLPDGHVKIMDFGIARVTENRDATRLTQEGWVIGTLLYMAPEQFAGGEIDALCDIFAYGVVSYELLTGRHPFQAPDSRTLMYKISFEEPPPISEFLPDCPSALERIVRRILQKDRELRYQSLKDVQFDLEVVRIELRKRRAEELLAQAQTLVNSNDLETAQPILIQALDLDPSNPALRGLREGVQKRLQHRALLPRIDALLKAAEENISDRRFADAVRRFEAALKLDDENPAILSRLNEARSLLDRSQEAQSLVADARREFEKQNFTVAYRTASEALRHDSNEPTALQLLSRIQAEMERRQRELRIADAMRRAEGLVLLRSYDEAIDLLVGLGPDAESPQVASLLSRLRTEKAAQERRDQLRAEMAGVTDLLRARKLTEAVERLEKLNRDFPEEKEVLQLLAYSRKELEAEARAKAIREVASRAGALVESKDFNSGLALLEEGLRQYPGETALIRVLGSTMAAKAAWEREQAISGTLRECAELRSQQRFAEAIERVEATLRDYSAEPELVALLEELEQDWARKRRADAVRKAAEQAAQMLANEKPAEAQQLLRQALNQYPGESNLTGLLQRADEEVRALEKARAIESIAGQVSGLTSANEFIRALAVVDQGLQTWQREPRLLEIRQSIADAQAAWKRRQEIASYVQRANALAAKLKFSDALALIDEGLRKYPDESQLDQLRTRITEDWQLHKRQEAVRGIASEARLLLSRHRLDEAAEVLKEGLAQYAGETDLEKLSEQVREAIRARERKRTIERLIHESQDLAAARRFAEARKVLEQGLESFPGDADLQRQSESVRTAAEKWEREQAVAQAIAEAERLAGELRFDDALGHLAGFPEYTAELAGTRRRIERDFGEHKRREAIRKGAADAEGLLEKGELDAAAKLLQRLSSHYPGEPQWGPLTARLAGAQAERRAAEERRRTVEETVRDCGQLMAQARFDEAQQKLAAALDRYTGEAELLELQEQLNRSREEHRRAEAIEKARAEAGAMIEAGRFEEAVASLRQACADYPDEAPLRFLLARTEKLLADRNERDRAVKECTALLGQQNLEEAIRAVERALMQFPSDAELLSLAARARDELELRRRQEAVASLTRDVQGLAKAHEFDRALALLDRGLANWGGEKALLELKQAVGSDQELWKREQARRQVVQEVHQLLRRERFRQAREKAENGLQSFPEDPELLRLRNDCRMREILAQAGGLAAEGKPAEALRIMEESGPECASAPEWQNLRSRLLQEVAALERAIAIRKMAEEARALSDQGKFEEAMTLLDQGFREWPGEALLDAARRHVIAARKAHERRVAIDAAAAKCVRLADEGHLEDAIEAVEAALREFANEPVLQQVRARFEDARRAEERRRQRLRDLEELRSLEGSIAQAAGPAGLADVGEAAQRISAEYPADEEIQSGAARVREHLADIETARNALLKGNFDEALQISRRYLSRFPGHVTFQAFDREAEAVRQAADLEGIRRRAEDEPDLAKRANILEAALARYPGQAWVAAELQITRNKLSLVEGIVAQARGCEASGDWGQALEHWNTVATIYERYPNLAQEIERVRAARERANAQATASWVVQVEPLIQGGEFGKAGQVLDRALAELPESEPLQKMGRALHDLRERERRIRELLGAMRGLRDGRNWESFGAHAAEALQLGSNNPALLKIVLEKLIEYARGIVETDWRKAEQWIALVRTADPAYAVPEALQRSIAKKKKAAAVEAALAEAKRLQAAGSLRDARLHLEAVLREFPSENQLETALRAIEEELQKYRAKIVAQLNEIRAASERAAAPAELDPLDQRVAAITAKVRDNPELVAAASAASHALGARRRALGRARITGVLRSQSKYIAIAAGTAGVLIAGILLVPRMLAPARPISVTISSDTAGAAVAAGGEHCTTPQCTLGLRPGAYTLTATKEGFRPISQPLNVSSRDPRMNVPLVFEPLPEELQVNTNFESGSVYLDNGTAVPLRDGQFSTSGLVPGRHSIRVTGGDADFHAEWQSAAGTSPQLLGGISAKNLDATVLANAGGSGTVACNCPPGAILVDGSPAGQTRSGEAAPISQLQPGTRQLAVGGRSVVVNVRPNPSMNVFLALDRNAGTLVINTGEDDVRVFLNNRLYPRRTEHGVLRIPVDVGKYSIRVEKNYFRSPGAQTADITKGVEKQVTFNLAPIRPAAETPPTQPRPVPPPPPAETKTVEVKPPDTEPQDWAKAAASGRIQDLQEYIRKHPGGPHERDAQAQVDQLQRAEASRSDQAAWDGVDRNSKASLQAYLANHSGGAHAAEARNLLDGIQRRESVEVAVPPQKGDQQRPAARAQDAQAILRTLSEYEAAFNRMDLPAMGRVYDPMPAALRDQFRDFKSVSFQIRPTDQPAINGDSATVTCTRTQSMVAKQGGRYATKPERVRVTLARTGNQWVIREIASF